jgi:hypothetical protein
MGRRVAVAVLLVLLVAAAGATVALIAGDDDANDTAGGPTTSSPATASTATPSTSAPTTAPPTTTTPPVVGECGLEQAAIVAAVNDGVDGARDRTHVEQCRLAAIDPSWAAVLVVPNPGVAFEETTIVLRGGAGSWAVVGRSTDACAQATQQVLADLGIVCVGGGGL